MTFLSNSAFFLDFQNQISGSNPVETISKGLIGNDFEIPGLHGPNKLIYADYVASGRAITQVEDFIRDRVLPLYSNGHTDASYCGAYISAMRAEARQIVARSCGAEDGYCVVFTGSGAISGVHRILHLFDVKGAVEKGKNPIVFIGPYEHHSNILPWRETGAEVVEIREAASGGPDLHELESRLWQAQGRLIIGAFGAASNVTGIKTDVLMVTRLLKKYGALAVWDYAGAGPYVPINASLENGCELDALVVSPHKFIGGPAASGVLIVKNSAVEVSTPTMPGGGTVTFVSPWKHDYTDNVSAREEAGTPNIIGDIRAALVFLVKEAIGNKVLEERQEGLKEIALKAWKKNPNIELLGNPEAKDRLPVFSFRIKAADGKGYVHQQLFTRMLSDVYGIQARGGCACAGPYAHRLLEIDEEKSEDIRSSIANGDEIEKPGWTRLNFSVLLSDEKAQFILDAVNELALNSKKYIGLYTCDEATARFKLEAA